MTTRDVKTLRILNSQCCPITNTDIYLQYINKDLAGRNNTFNIFENKTVIVDKLERIFRKFEHIPKHIDIYSRHWHGGVVLSLLYTSDLTYELLFRLLSKQKNSAEMWSDLVDGLAQFDERITIYNFQIDFVNNHNALIKVGTDVVNTEAVSRLLIYSLLVTINEFYNRTDENGECIISVKIMDIPLKIKVNSFYTSEMLVTFKTL